MAKKPRIATDASATLENRALAGLGALRAEVPDGTVEVEAEVEAEGARPGRGDAIDGGRLLVRREKKGRGGKAATVIEGLHADTPALESLARELRKGLGCGTQVEGRNVVVQGAQTDRVRAWLLGRGAKTVIVGN